MKYTDKSVVHTVFQKEDLQFIIGEHKKDLFKKYTLENIVDTTRIHTISTFENLNSYNVHTKIGINPFLLLYEMSIPNKNDLECFILMPSIIPHTELELVSTPLGITGKFFKSIFLKYTTCDIFSPNEIITSVKMDSSSNQLIDKLSSAIKRLLYMHAIIIKEAEAEKP